MLCSSHDLSCYSCAVMFLVFLVVCMVLLAAQGRLQGRLRVAAQDVDPAAGPSPPGGNSGHEGALKNEVQPREPSHRQPIPAASTHTRRPHKIHTTNLHRKTSATVLPHSSAPERSTQSSARPDLSASSGDIARRMTTVVTAEAGKGGPTTSPPPSAASPRFSGSGKPETGPGYSAEARSTSSTEGSRGTTGDSVVRLHPLPIDTPARDDEDDSDYDDGERLGNGDKDRRR
ncbi:hypothetical protein HPB52_008680 [Rhipicephalus sanguineus]|uniref:Uncharacterized protein n=1 Tax=Rhipicephalus sanguineus TaxID=34632 RepID=A0A9D4T5Y4_RHISA|nr:hypothetical protein HPB52_008680 [Rhipicephalus sanguineus]